MEVLDLTSLNAVISLRIDRSISSSAEALLGSLILETQLVESENFSSSTTLLWPLANLDVSIERVSSLERLRSLIPCASNFQSLFRQERKIFRF